MRWMRHVAYTQERRICTKSWPKIRKGDIQLEGNIKMVLEEIGCVDMNWIQLAQDRV